MIFGLSFFVFLLIGMPVGFVLLGSAIVFALELGNVRVLGAFPAQIYTSLEIFDLLAIPLFILLGEIMSEGGMTRQLFAAAVRALRWLPRSLAYVNLVCNLFLASILGSGNAQVAVMSRVALPEMTKAGYKPEFAAALTAASALLGPIVPPSMVFIIYAVIARVSISDMFLGGIIPGLLLFFFISLVIVFSKVYRDDKPTETTDGSGAGDASPLAVLAALTVPAVIVGSIVGGIVTPTESAGVATVVAFVVTQIFFNRLDFKRLYEILLRTAINSAIVLFLIAAARAFGYILTFYRVPQETANLMVALSDSPVTFLLIVVLALLLIGALMDGMAAIIVLVPILLPIAVTHYGIDPVAFGVIFCLTTVLGLITPPVGTVLYIASAISNIGIGKLSLAITPFVLAGLALIVLLVLFPILITVLI